jgi:hypothetical protein
MDIPRRNKPISVWTERDVLEGKEVKALVMILDGPGCSWWRKKGCTMCGYCNDIRQGEVTPEDLFDQYRMAMRKWDGHRYIKIFTSGSFLDPKEVPEKVQIEILRSMGSDHDVSRVLVESRPEFVREENLSVLSTHVPSLEIAMGLETSSDPVRRDLIHKGFGWDQYVKAGEIIFDLELELKTYLLMKPPFMGERQSISDMTDSIRDIHNAFPGSRISVNPMNIQSKTSVEGLFKRGHYRPPWLWSLLEVLKKASRSLNGETHLMSSPTAGGKKRGAHNCGKCDDIVLSAILEFSLKNDPDRLPEPMSCCKDEWRAYLDASRSNPAMSSKV